MTSETDTVNPNLSPTAKRVLDEFVGKLEADDNIGNAAADRMRKLIYGSKPPKADDFAKALFDQPEGDTQ